MTDYTKCKILLGKFIREFNENVIKINIFTLNSSNYENKYLKQCNEIIEGHRTIFVFEIEDLLTTSYSELKDLVFFNTQRFLKLLESTLVFLFTNFFSNLIGKKKKTFFCKII